MRSTIVLGVALVAGACDGSSPDPAVQPNGLCNLRGTAVGTGVSGFRL